MLEHVYHRATAASDPAVTITITGGSDIFRFAVNLLDDQVEFCKAGREILVEHRERCGAKNFDTWAASMLGAERYAELRPHYFIRDTHCVACERELKSREPRRKLKGAQIVCRDCDRGDGS